MRDLVTALLELQELEIVLEESRIVHGDSALPAAAQVERRVGALRQAVPPSELRRYDALRRGGPAVVKEHDGTCGGCHLNVPRGDLNRMLRLEVDWLCPNCGRYLLVSS
jgi:predicted  nucleic acid-binding Zn-ribbon protein